MQDRVVDKGLVVIIGVGIEGHEVGMLTDGARGKLGSVQMLRVRSVDKGHPHNDSNRLACSSQSVSQSVSESI